MISGRCNDPTAEGVYVSPHYDSARAVCLRLTSASQRQEQTKRPAAKVHRGREICLREQRSWSRPALDRHRPGLQRRKNGERASTEMGPIPGGFLATTG